MKLTPADIRNSKRKSGYDHVGYNVSPGQTAPKPYQAVVYGGKRSKAGMAWIGKRRVTALEAAQDYCSYINTGKVVPAPTLPTITHKRPKRRQRPTQPQHIAEKRREVRTWDREVAAALPMTNHVYLIAIKGCRDAVKIGESWDAHYRAADGQTWHWREVVVLGYVTTDIPKHADKPVHAKFAKHHIANEWFRPASEVLSYFGVSNAEFFRKTATPRKAAA